MDDENNTGKNTNDPSPKDFDKDSLARLKRLLNTSELYSEIIGEKLRAHESDRPPDDNSNIPTSESRKRKSAAKDDATRTDGSQHAKVADSNDGKPQEFDGQPSLVTGAELRSYQRVGVQWLARLYMNGVNGILADEMGLGKTLQTISFLAYLREKGIWGPFLVVCPLSTLANWVGEFKKFTPDIPAMLYHGSPTERVELRKKLVLPTSTKPETATNKRKRPRTMRDEQNTTETFPVIVTSYEIAMKDRKYFQSYQFKYLVVDESHRIKNMNCKLIIELKKYNSANRLLLTGTPLQNNLAELWSLLNFLLPNIFDDVDRFLQWFQFSDSGQPDDNQPTPLDSEQTSQVITQLHGILRPFLLRRLKEDVEKTLPRKKEYLLTAPLTSQQLELYNAILNRQLRPFLIDQGSHGTSSESSAPSSPPAEKDSRSRRRSKVTYCEAEEEDHLDDDSFMSLLEMETQREQERSDKKSEAAKKTNRATKNVNNMKLQNLVMQLRKACNHPWLFDWPSDPNTNELIMNDDIVNSSGKMLLLDRLLDALISQNQKVVIFSQFTTMLDIIDDWATEMKGWRLCRIDGSTKQDERQQHISDFNEDKSPTGPKLFLASTRAGGMGINLIGAATAIFIDNDFNPQVDLQAQARCHRLGQTQPVLIFRFVSANTVENKILQRAGAKRRLEALVIGGKFDMSSSARKKQETIAELAEILRQTEGEKIPLINDDDRGLLTDETLAALLDRSDEAFDRSLDWTRQDAAGAHIFETAQTQGLKLDADASEDGMRME